MRYTTYVSSKELVRVVEKVAQPGNLSAGAIMRQVSASEGVPTQYVREAIHDLLREHRLEFNVDGKMAPPPAPVKRKPSRAS